MDVPDVTYCPLYKFGGGAGWNLRPRRNDSTWDSRSLVTFPGDVSQSDQDSEASSVLAGDWFIQCHVKAVDEA